MRLKIEIDERLLRKAKRCSCSHDTKETIEAVLRLLLAIQSQRKIRRLRGKVRWDGDLNQSRLTRAGLNI